MRGGSDPLHFNHNLYYCDAYGKLHTVVFLTLGIREYRGFIP